MASISRERICNLALSHIGDEGRIENLETEKSEQARECRLWYDFAREQALEDFDWNFARRRDVLSLSGDDPPPDWNFRYSAPTKMIAAREIYNPLGPKADIIPYDIELNEAGDAKTILTDQPEATLINTTNVTQTGLFTPYFVITLAILISSYVAVALTGKRTLAEAMTAKYTGMLRVAGTREGNQPKPREARDADWIRARD